MVAPISGLTAAQMIAVEGDVGVQMSDTERIIFNLEFDRMMALNYKERTIVNLFKKHLGYIYKSCCMAKKEFDGVDFSGLMPKDGQFGWSPIRPEHILGTGMQTWRVNVTSIESDGWTDLWGTSATKSKPHEDALVTVVGMANYNGSPKSTALKHTIMGTEYPVVYFEPGIRIGNISVIDIVKPYRVLPKKEFHVEVKYDRTGLDELGATGVTFALADYLRTKSPDTEA